MYEILDRQRGANFAVENFKKLLLFFGLKAVLADDDDDDDLH